MKKWAAIYSTKKSSWVSCQVITPNIIETYEAEYGSDCMEAFHFGDNNTKMETYNLLNGIANLMPERILFLDHRPHPISLIKRIYDIYEGQNLPELVFHLYGDFTLFTKEWIESTTILKQFPVKFIVASERQRQLVNKFIINPEGLVFYMPFPVRKDQYYYHKGIRDKTRGELGFQEDEKYFLYTGRLSAQKNINQLVKTFGEYKKLFGSKAKLIIAGQFDNLGQPFFGNYFPPNYSYLSFENIVKKLPESIRDSISYIGSLTSGELLKYYNACDIFISLSLHNDEDYGMSPAEALLCGMPMVLSSWGGYASFDVPGSKVKLIDIEMENSFFKVPSKAILKSLIEFGNLSISHEERQKISDSGVANFSVEGNRNRIKEIMEAPAWEFTGWSKTMVRYNNCFVENWGRPFTYDTSEVKESDRGELKRVQATKAIYREVYSEYTTSNKPVS